MIFGIKIVKNIYILSELVFSHTRGIK